MEDYKNNKQSRALLFLKKGGLCLLVMTIILYFILAIKYLNS